MKSKKLVLVGFVLLAITGLLALSGCKNDSVPPEAHTHTFDENRWESDAKGHWHPATCGHTEEKGGFASHTFGDWEVQTPSTDTVAGKLVKKCTTCSWTDEMEIPAGFVYIPAGKFKMGSNAEGVDENEKPVHGVTISKGYFMGKCEVTQKEYEKYCSYTGGEDKKPTEQYGEGDDYPAYYVSWYDAVVYCNKLSELMGLEPVTARAARPTQASGVMYPPAAMKAGTPSPATSPRAATGCPRRRSGNLPPVAASLRKGHGSTPTPEAAPSMRWHGTTTTAVTMLVKNKRPTRWGQRNPTG